MSNPLYKCPKCKIKKESHEDLREHMFKECKYEFWIATEIADKQKEKIESSRVDV